MYKPTLFCQGYGDNKPKSSTTAQEVKTLDGVYVEKVNLNISICLFDAFIKAEGESMGIRPVFELCQFFHAYLKYEKKAINCQKIWMKTP